MQTDFTIPYQEKYETDAPLRDYWNWIAYKLSQVRFGLLELSTKVQAIANLK